MLAVHIFGVVRLGLGYELRSLLLPLHTESTAFIVVVSVSAVLAFVAFTSTAAYKYCY
jgi:hypothetical protein